ncbi:MAG: hypothetical protein NZL85_03275, partial [Fimbriimonadales bacterium]|nr:hypothetical protein [Fimbriimonadales bacterium]
MRQEAGTQRAIETSAEPSFRVARVLIAGGILVTLTSIVVASAELVAQTIQIGMMQLPPAVVALLFLLALLNRGLRWLDRRAESMGRMPELHQAQPLGRMPRLRWAFTPHELAALFVMMLFGAMLASRGLMERLLP